MVKQQKYYAVARGRVTGIYRKPYDSDRQTHGFSNSLCRAFKCRSDAAQFLRENSDAGPGAALPVNSKDSGSDVIDLTSDNGDNNDADNAIDLIIDDDHESPPRRVLRSSTTAQRRVLRSSTTAQRRVPRSSTAANRTTKPAPSVLQTLPNTVAMRSANTPSFPSHAPTTLFQDSLPVEGIADVPFKYPCTITGSDKVYEGRNETVTEMRKNTEDPAPSKQPSITATDITVGDNQAGKNDIQGLTKDQQFFKALLTSSVNEFVEAAASETKSKALWQTICNRVGLIALESRVEPSYQCVKTHFNARAVLVLEEARAAISSALSERNQNPTTSLKVVLCTRTNQVLSFQKKDTSNDFKEGELQFLQYGVVFQCVPNGSRDEQAVFLGCLMGADTKQISRSKTFQIQVFGDDLSQVSTCSEWTLEPVGTTFINYMRQYKATTDENYRKVPFLGQLMGHPQQKVDETLVLTDQYDRDSVPMNDLNESQERAATSFLHSPPGTITLVQGYVRCFRGFHVAANNLTAHLFPLYLPYIQATRNREILFACIRNVPISQVPRETLNGLRLDEQGCIITCKSLLAILRSPHDQCSFGWRREEVGTAR